MTQIVQDIAFRADASVGIGSGHVMRCLALADVLATHGHAAHFLCRDLNGNLGAAIRAAGHVVHLLPTGENARSDEPYQNKSDFGVKSWEEDARHARAIFDEIKPSWVVVDHYGLDARWEQAAVPGSAHLMVIDDLADRPHRADLLLDQNLGRAAEDYATMVPSGCQLLVGPAYALLRKEFEATRERSLGRRDHGVIRKIMISMGGSDQPNATGAVLEQLASTGVPDGARVTAILGQQCPWIDRVRALATSLPFPTEVRVNVSDMAEHMASADLAICAGGISAWERCCLGLPSLMLILAENQKPSAEALVREHAAILLGALEDGRWQTRLRQALAELNTPGSLPRLSAKAAQITDGRGCERVYQAMRSRTLHLRKASASDVHRVWEWRHAGGAARYYRSARETPFEEHCAWFEQALTDKRRVLLIFEEADTPVAHVRLDVEPDRNLASIGICIAPECRGRRVGQKALAAAVSYAARSGFGQVIAEIHERNGASVRLFEAVGFTRHGRDGEFLQYRLSTDHMANGLGHGRPQQGE